MMAAFTAAFGLEAAGATAGCAFLFFFTMPPATLEMALSAALPFLVAPFFGSVDLVNLAIAFLCDWSVIENV